MVDRRTREIRARMAETSEPFNRAARELDKQRASQANTESLDPATTDVLSKAQALVDLLTEGRPEAANRDCHEAREFTRAIDSAMAAGMDLVDQLTLGEKVTPAVFEKAVRTMAEQVQAAQLRTVNGLNFAIAGDVGHAYALVGLARAAAQRHCPLGQRPTNAMMSPSRSRIGSIIRFRVASARVHDLGGGGVLRRLRHRN